MGNQREGHHSARRTTFGALAAGLITVVLSVASNPQAAHACSCAPEVAPADAIGRSPIAFIGTAVDKIEHTTTGSIEYIVEVSEVIKGEVPTRISIWTANNEAACGTTIGSFATGFVPFWDSGSNRWTVGLCGGQMDARQLRSAGVALIPIAVSPPTAVSITSTTAAAPVGLPALVAQTTGPEAPQVTSLSVANSANSSNLLIGVTVGVAAAISLVVVTQRRRRRHAQHQPGNQSSELQ